MLLSIPREIGVLAGLPENACVGACAFRGVLLRRALVRDAMRSLPVLCHGALSPAVVTQGRSSDLEVPLEEEYLCQLLIILTG